jgi:hypothetical protein
MTMVEIRGNSTCDSWFAKSGVLRTKRTRSKRRRLAALERKAKRSLRKQGATNDKPTDT